MKPTLIRNSDGIPMPLDSSSCPWSGTLGSKRRTGIYARPGRRPVHRGYRRDRPQLDDDGDAAHGSRLYAVLDPRRSFRLAAVPVRTGLRAHSNQAPTMQGEDTMIRCVRLWTGEDRNSHFEEGSIELEPGERGDWLSGKIAVTASPFRRRHPAEPSPGTMRRSGSSSSRSAARWISRRARASTSSSGRATSCSRRTRPARAIAGNSSTPSLAARLPGACARRGVPFRAQERQLSEHRRRKSEMEAMTSTANPMSS